MAVSSTAVRTMLCGRMLSTKIRRTFKQTAVFGVVTDKRK